MPIPRLLIIGLDCAEPTLLERWRGDLPHLDRLMRTGVSGQLESCIPAITVPAWSCLLSGRDPGELGIYGFRNRAARGYGALVVADGRAVRHPRLWDYLGAAGWRVAIIGVPGTYPPPAVNGVAVSCFLAPSTTATFTHPPELADRLTAWLAQPYLLDVPDFRSTDKDRILADIYTLCDQRFAVAQRLLAEEQPDLLMLVDMGTDRVHHAFWKHMDPAHPDYVAGSPYQDAIFAYYRHLDRRIGELLAACDAQTAVLVVSDHGARPLMGGFRLNQWLLDQGYLALHTRPVVPEPFDPSAVDWSRTRAWGAGGYYGRIFLNVRGREPAGAIAPADYEAERSALAAALTALPGPDGAPLGNRVFTPQQIYRKVRGIAPDLLLYAGDLAWRVIGKLGGDGWFTRENDTGPDDANHAQHGLFIFADLARPAAGRPFSGLTIYDILPSLLARYGIAAPPDLRGRVAAW
ncbi:MAG: alkaline phosphatase family protein [Chloroflexi bacterium]|nr:alkaline phosphatase family protein [Chloroflexota bacterium]